MRDAEQREVNRARAQLAVALDDLESRLAPNNVAKVAWWWVKRSARTHPVGWTVGGVATFAVVAGLLSWAALDDSED